MNGSDMLTLFYWQDTKSIRYQWNPRTERIHWVKNGEKRVIHFSRNDFLIAVENGYVQVEWRQAMREWINCPTIPS